MQTSTIVGISTSIGEAAIHMLRLSGPEACSIVNKIFKGKDITTMQSHTVAYGHIFDREDVIDEVLVSVFLPPRSYTKEPVVEISCHGGVTVLFLIENLLLKHGAVRARAGEFTERAFLNGRIDLVQAEAVMNVIEAGNIEELKLANANIKGKLSGKIADLRNDLLNVIAQIEVNIDYPEYEDVEQLIDEALMQILGDFLNKIETLIKEAQSGKTLSEGVNVVIIGRPNVGKSSILNYLLDYEKAIVTNIEGTTRDIIESKVRLGHVTLNLIDTAGIRKTEDVVEQIGVNRSREALEMADIVLFVLSDPDGYTLEDENLRKEITKPVITIVNKTDVSKNLIELMPNTIAFSTVEKFGKSALEDEITKHFPIFSKSSNTVAILANERQIGLLEKTREYIIEARQAIEGEMPLDLVLIDINTAWKKLGEIIGTESKDELLDALFTNFCLGK